MCTRSLSAGSILDQESRLWLGAIHRRLAGRVAIRRPYYAEINRSIPYDIFATARQVLKDLRHTEPDCYISSNRKAEVISFTSLCLLQEFLSCLSGMSKREVRKFFTRKLTGVKCHHKVKLIVSDEKDFALVYKKSRGQLTIEFNYGEWNANGFPQHRVDNKLMLHTKV